MVCSKSIRSSPFKTFLIFSGAESHMSEISQGPKCTSQVWNSAVIGLRFLPLDLADISGAGTRVKPLTTSAWKALG